MTTLQKAVMPGREQAWAAGDDLLCGYVVAAADVAWATTPRELFDAHGLGFPGSPFTEDTPVLDVLRFPATALLRTVDATGRIAGPDGPAGEGFADHPPFTGTGFAAASGHLVPLWWLEPMRVPAGSELWRVHADGREELLSVYTNVASGWQPGQSSAVGPSDVSGVFARWRGERVWADPLPNGRIVIAAADRLEGLRLTERGLWAATVDRADLDELYALRLTATWRGLPFQVVRRAPTESGPVARMVYLGRDSFAAEAAGLVKTDAAVYEASAPIDELSDLRGVELSAPVSPSPQP